jgi:hypothetical protein
LSRASNCGFHSQYLDETNPFDELRIASFVPVVVLVITLVMVLVIVASVVVVAVGETMEATKLINIRLGDVGVEKEHRHPLKVVNVR